MLIPAEKASFYMVCKMEQKNEYESYYNILFLKLLPRLNFQIQAVTQIDNANKM